MNVHGFWSNANARDHKDRSEHRRVPQAPPGRPDPQLMPQGTWRDHPDQAVVGRALVAKCQLPEVKHRDS